MRLIDADTFKEDMKRKYGAYARQPQEDIDAQPTIDAVPVVHGCWIKASGMMPPEYFGKHVCSVCDAFAPNEFHGTHEWLSKICPSCGARMDEEDE